MPKDSHDEFHAFVDTIIEAANSLPSSLPSSRISSVLLYAAARYNVFNYVRAGESLEHQDEAVGYFLGQYRLMLEEHFADAAFIGESQHAPTSGIARPGDPTSPPSAKRG